MFEVKVQTVHYYYYYYCGGRAGYSWPRGRRRAYYPTHNTYDDVFLTIRGDGGSDDVCSSDPSADQYTHTGVCRSSVFALRGSVRVRARTRVLRNLQRLIQFPFFSSYTRNTRISFAKMFNWKMKTRREYLYDNSRKQYIFEFNLSRERNRFYIWYRVFFFFLYASANASYRL